MSSTSSKRSNLSSIVGQGGARSNSVDQRGARSSSVEQGLLITNQSN
jgi:hypothetical protein